MNINLINRLIDRFGPHVRGLHIRRVAQELNTSPSSLLARRDIMTGRGTYDLSKLNLDQPKPEPELTPVQIEEKIKAKFHALKIMSNAVAKGQTRALIVSGPGGLGKTYEVIKAVKEINQNFDEIRDTVKGMVRPTGIYKALFEHQANGQTLIFDDADSIFQDNTSLNLLKAACDTTTTRFVNWRAEHKLEDELGDKLPNCFEFHGSIIFITNLDFKELIDRGSRLSPHFEALRTRTHYLDLELKTKAEYLHRIRQVMSECLANNKLKLLGIGQPSDCSDILNFMSQEINDLADLSLRTVIRLAQAKTIGGSDWKTLAKTLG